MNLPNPFTKPEVVTHYEDWYQAAGFRADREEKSLLSWLLSHFPDAHSILEVGSGTGHFTRWFKQQGLQSIGLDLSPNMLKEAINYNGQDYVLGDAGRLPFSSNSVDISAVITSLEFVSDHLRVLSEISRIARQGIILGVINRHSLLGKKYKQAGGPVWKNANLFTLNELKGMVRDMTGGNGRIVWRTTLWPFFSASLPLPWGGFIGLGVLWFPKRGGKDE